MSTSKPVVYLEDIEPNHFLKSSQSLNQDSAISSQSSEVKGPVNDTKVTTVKRQRTLADMFSGSQEEPSEPSAKKLKLAPSGGSVTKVTAARPAAANRSGVQKLNSIPFSLATYVDSLSDEQKKLLALECEVMGKVWLKLLKDEITKPYFIELKRFLWEEGVRGKDTPKSVKIYPSPSNIYAWSNTPLGKIKVVIVGQDPYHGAGQAHGLCFSVPHGVAVPPSLRNIYAELKSEYPEFDVPKHGNLSAWAANGVLMLNTCLTVRAGAAGSHSNKGWEVFTDKIVDIVDKYGGANLPSRMGGTNSCGIGRGVVFLAWGAWAGKRVAKLSKTKHYILSSAHPSPFSANRGFLGNNHFKLANEWLVQKYGQDGKVDWCNLEVSNSSDES